jgi:hypothetical protein
MDVVWLNAMNVNTKSTTPGSKTRRSPNLSIARPAIGTMNATNSGAMLSAADMVVRLTPNATDNGFMKLEVVAEIIALALTSSPIHAPIAADIDAGVTSRSLMADVVYVFSHPSRRSQSIA